MSKGSAKSLMPLDFNADSQITHMLRAMEKHMISWANVFAILLERRRFMMLPPRLQEKVRNFSYDPHMTFEQFLRNLSIKELGFVVHPVFRQVPNYNNSLKMGLRMQHQHLL